MQQLRDYLCDVDHVRDEGIQLAQQSHDTRISLHAQQLNTKYQSLVLLAKVSPENNNAILPYAYAFGIRI